MPIRAVVGPHGIAIRASHTLTFIGNKPGLHTAMGRDYAGWWMWPGSISIPRWCRPRGCI
jgi:hypothetical protein